MKKIKLSIVLPVFNEEKNIPLVIEKYKKIAKLVPFELIFVEDGGSTDNTKTILQKFEKEYVFIKNVFIDSRGYGVSVYKGLKSAKGEFVGWTHADLQTDPNDTLIALDLIKKQEKPNKTYVKGKRIGRPIMDKLINTLGMSFFETIILKKFLYDINAQPNVFHRSFLKFMKNPPGDFSFDLYVYYLAKLNNYNVKKFPVLFPKRIHGESAWNVGMKQRMKFIKRTINFTFKLKRLLKNDDNKT